MIPLYTEHARYLEERLDVSVFRASRDVRMTVEAILERVRSEGDRALIALTKELDGVDVEALRVSAEEIAASAERAPEASRLVLHRAAENIKRFHEKQNEVAFRDREQDGSVVGQRIVPLASAGVYVPGGAASYPSSVLMNVLPAKIAGVRRIVVVTPPGSFERSPELAAALDEVAAEEVYRVGGAQAIAALAYGTESVAPVDKIVGPGNAYVAEAKRLVFGVVGIDAIAGPSEIVVLADETAHPGYVAADLLSQAEHGSGDERSILVTTSRELAERARSEIERQVASLPRADDIRSVLERHGALVVVPTLQDAVDVVDRIAPEHLEILTREPEAVGERIQNAGAIFVGPLSPVPVGDFYAGPNHVLPTGSTARFASPLGVYDFTKRSSWIHYSAERLERDRSDIEAFARMEGFEAHARAISIRFESEKELD